MKTLRIDEIEPTLELHPGNPSLLYDLACNEARNGEREPALDPN